MVRASATAEFSASGQTPIQAAEDHGPGAPRASAGGARLGDRNVGGPRVLWRRNSELEALEEMG
jgi:hypothetical protein